MPEEITSVATFILTSERTQNRLGHLRSIVVPEETIDNLDVLDVATAFVAGSEHRLNTFGVVKA